MKIKIKAFTLVELILVLAIGAILLGISTNWYITSIANANNKNNKQVDLQSSVSSSLDVIKNTLKKTSQIHLVGKNVYNPELSVDELNNRGLDPKYNYIALSKDMTTGRQILVNLVFNKNLNGGKFESFPLLAQERKDNMQHRHLSYDIKFYQGDGDYRKKLDKNILNLTLIGNVHDTDSSGKRINPEHDVTFELTEDIYIQNINQILVSKHLEGGIDEITAIAYDNNIVHGESLGHKFNKMSFVFAIDDSYSMLFGMDGKRIGAKDPKVDPEVQKELELDEFDKLIANESVTTKKTRRAIARDSIVKFLKKLDEDAKKAGIEVDAYIYTWGRKTMYEDINNKSILHGTKDPNKKYLYPIDELKKYYGPYKLGKSDDNAFTTEINNMSKIKHHLYKTCKMGKPYWIDGTNTGIAILQGMEILNQLREKNGNSQKYFFILMTDGVPTDYATQKSTFEYKKVDGEYTPLKDSEDLFFTAYRGFISNAEDYYQTKYGTQEYFVDDKYILKYKKEARGATVASSNSDLPRLYIKQVTSIEKGNNKPNTFDKAYLIGFSAKESDKNFLGINDKKYDCNWQDLNILKNKSEATYSTEWNFQSLIEHDVALTEVTIGDKTFKSTSGTVFGIPDGNETGSIKKFLSLEGTSEYKKDMVEVFDTNGSASLDNAFNNIAQDIGDVSGAFDGPKKLTGR